MDVCCHRRRLPGATVNKQARLQSKLAVESMIDGEKDPPTPFRSMAAGEGADMPV